MIKSEYQQPSFKFSTCYAEYDLHYMNYVSGEEKWEVTVNYIGKKVKAKFECPIDWSRSYIFDWLVRMEIDNI